LLFNARELGSSAESARDLFDSFARQLSAAGAGWVERPGIDSPPVRMTSFEGRGAVVILTMSNNRSLVVDIRASDEEILRMSRIQKAAVKPFGIAIGISTCRDAAAVLAAEPTKPQDAPSGRSTEWVEVRAQSPQQHYPGATMLEVNCFSGADAEVDDLTMSVADGESNQAARDAYRVLASKYKRVEGTAVPMRGPAYARFSAPGVEVELEVSGGGRDFSVTYTESNLFASVRKAQQRKRNSL